ncbi:hypothetical protein HAX54_030139 [Datura stramonium]|uniref:Uncharacterized protein n=1 Tax=Datura stramonium TaxID=4076 RepID=A0ABS8VAL2_DATST|nr:hypothetical protein [Datura stramonium]
MVLRDVLRATLLVCADVPHFPVSIRDGSVAQSWASDGLRATLRLNFGVASHGSVKKGNSEYPTDYD